MFYISRFQNNYVMLSKENKSNDIRYPNNEINRNVHLRGEENSYMTSFVGYDNVIAQDKTYVLDIGFKSIKYVSDELQLKTVEIISDLIELGIPERCLDDILLEGIKKYYETMCIERSQNYLINIIRDNKGE